MAGLADRLPMLVELRSENRHLIRSNAADPQKDRDGSCSGMLALDLRFFGVADYVLRRDVTSFRSQLSESAEIRLRLLQRFEAGEAIDPSYVAMLAYNELFNALAAANTALARSLAQHMGGRDDIEKVHDHPFDHTMGYSLRAVVLDDLTEIQKWLPASSSICQDTGMNDFQGYWQVFEAIATRDAAAADRGLSAVVQGHKRQSKGKGVFVNTEDELLCIWGVGIANLARSRGVCVQAIPPLIPDDLL